MSDPCPHTSLSSCLACGGSRLTPYLDLGTQPHANSYHRGGEPLPSYPLEVSLCRDCAHSQLSVAVDPRSMFENYLYVTGTAATNRRHCQELAADALRRIGRQRPRVLDIACNDGTLLAYFRELGADVVGVDPAKNLAELTRERGLPVVSAFWDRAAAERVLEQGGLVDVVTASNVLGHTLDPTSFLAACRTVLRPGGLAIVQFPYGTETFTRGEFDQVYHEHLSYFLARSFERVAARAGFAITDVLLTPIHGGSVRFFLQDALGRTPAHSSALSSLVEAEAAQGLHALEAYREFATEVSARKRGLRALLERIRSEARGVVGYGASAKGNTMLNHFGLSLDYLVDDNPLKWGLLTPGRDIPIRSPEALTQDERPLAVVLTAWNFAEEIGAKVLALRQGRDGDSFVSYVPRVYERPIAVRERLGTVRA